MCLTASGRVLMENWRLLKTETTVKALVVSSSTPARVITMKVPNPANIEIQGLTVSDTDIRNPAFISSLTSLFLSSRILERKESRLRKLVLAKTSLSRVSAGRLAQLVLSLEEVSLLFTQLTTEQLSVLLTALGDSEGLNLQRLNLTRSLLLSL